MVQRKNRYNRQKVAVARLESSVEKYQEQLKSLEKNDSEHKKIALKLKRTNEALENTLKKMQKDY